jgi:hypothetical protein
MLPIELWTEVFSYLGCKELLSLATVSHLFLSLARLNLYRSVTLRNCSSQAEDTYKLLINDPKTAKKVVELHIVSYDNAWTKVAAFANMGGLQRLVFSGNPFEDDEGQQRFVQDTSILCPLLKEFTFSDGKRSPLPGNHFALRGIEQLTWESSTKC